MNNKFETEHIPLKDIDFGSRARERYKNLPSLANSIVSRGLIHSIFVLDKSKVNDWEGIREESLNENKPYLLLAGGRRTTAFKQFDIDDEIRATICDRPITVDEMKEIELMENIQREDLTWQEEVNLKKQVHDLQVKLKGKSVKGSQDKEGHSLEDTADMFGESKANTSYDIGLAKAIEKMPELKQEKTKGDARKRLRKLKKDLETQEKAEKAASKRTATPLDKQRKNLNDSYIVNSFFEGVSKIHPQSIDIVELDPPYGIDLVDQKKGEDLKKETYEEIKHEKYLEWMDKMLSDCYRVMKKHSWLILWFAPEPWFDEMLMLLRKQGFTVKAMPGIWSKGRGQTMQPNYNLANSYEMFFYARKGNPSIKQQGRSNVFDYAPVSPNNKIHPTERPIEMIQDVLKTFGEPGSKVLVPCAGSGNTNLAASNLDMLPISFDINEEYKDAYTVKVFSGEPTKYKSYT